ncbi:thiamine pyrophosphate-dependent enzyme [Actinomadura madurae]|nr:thiamine pyrophosphate-dependent enzyme [Actinomadura madurae]MCP9955581.1 thiamine pyrophosphate-dependent enzyme [Actinomadura madurae]MCP9984826.1 thiamine pyrophosphate-dependent enzyme [Actinomadura madurae]MCQ0021014.1 thiamine pyrophosphate-dependent enzyme [Actinomadura madurae]
MHVQRPRRQGHARAAGALATARTNRAPLVVVGQQDRRHLAHDPFLAGRLDGLVGQYPVWTNTPLRPQDAPAAIARAHHEAVTGAGPAIVVVPMDDWDQPSAPERGAAPMAFHRAVPATTEAIDGLVELVESARHPVIIVGAGVDSPPAWSALVDLAGRLGAPVWQEPFGARAGFPQDHPSFAGHLPSGRTAVPRSRPRPRPRPPVSRCGGPCLRSAGPPPTSRRDPGRGVALQPSRTSPPGPRPCATRIRQRSRRRPGLRPARRDRPEDGAPTRPVVAVLGDGSSLYGIQGLWSAAHYQTGVLFVVMSNGTYAIMDRLAEASGRGKAPWPSFTEVAISGIAENLGCPATRVTTHEHLASSLAELLPGLSERTSPLVLDVSVAPDPSYA